MAKRVSFSKLNLEIQEISAHHSDTEAALKDYYHFSETRTLLPAKFLGYSEDELLAEFHKRIEELEKTSSLTLLSSLEAKFRMDYLERCYQKKKDKLSRDFRLLHKKKANRASLEEDILERWKKHYPEHSYLISELIGALKYRHWLAHGRYWEPKLGRKYDYYDVYVLSEQIYNTLPFIN
jgi:hypothetical protein